MKISPNWETLKKHKGSNLPHWNCEKAIYHVRFRLADSIPDKKRQQWLEERKLILNSPSFRNKELNREERDRLKFLFSEKIEKYLEAGYGESHLRRSESARIVREALEHFNEIRYYLHAWSIMPNHVHVIVEPVRGYDIKRIVQTWKSFTARRINQLLRRTGQLWEKESYDHIIRSEKEYWFQIDYVWNNPEKAGLTNFLRWKVAGTGVVAGADGSSKEQSPEASM
jgi:REP element-mobilizing transposase RayT